MVSSSVTLKGRIIALVPALLPLVSAQTYSYTLQDTYSGSSFFDKFNFYSDTDPTHGFVQYVDEATASSSGLTGFGSGTAKWGVDTTNTYSNTSSGRPSVRLESKTNYNHGLFVADIKHMPGSICGVWPAFWTLGDSTWPSHGEMDIIEGVNLQSGDQMTAHTGDNCTMSFSGQTGPMISSDCALSTGGTAGCSVGSSKANDYGTDFNSNGGGVYVMQWTSEFMKLWFFPRGAVPASITAGAPDYTTFGTPQANFDGASCDIDSHFINHRLVFDTTFCGDWAGSVYEWSGCPLASEGAQGCINYVANNPTAFTEAYWEINSIKIYSEAVSSSTSSVSSQTSTSSSMSSTTSSSSSSISSSSSSSLSSSTPPKSSSSSTPTSSSSSIKTTTSSSSSSIKTSSSSSSSTPSKTSSSTTPSKTSSSSSSTKSISTSSSSSSSSPKAPTTTTTPSSSSSQKTTSVPLSMKTQSTKGPPRVTSK